VGKEQDIGAFGMAALHRLIELLGVAYPRPIPPRQ
jgi:hypothetical protein